MSAFTTTTTILLLGLHVVRTRLKRQGSYQRASLRSPILSILKKKDQRAAVASVISYMHIYIRFWGLSNQN